jgi:arginase
MREASLVERFVAAGLDVIDHGDMPCARWRPDREHRRPHNLSAVKEVARGLADMVEVALQNGETPLVIGGDCTVELGVLSGFLRQNGDLGLLYFDGGVDLRTPLDNPTGILDSMGVAHMLGEPGSAEELARIGPRFPLMTDANVVLFGYSRNEAEDEVLSRRSMPRYPVEQVRAGASRARGGRRRGARLPGGGNGNLCGAFGRGRDRFCGLARLRRAPDQRGPDLREALACLEVFASSRRFTGLVVTEFNPDHADEEGETAMALVQGLVGAVTGGITRSLGQDTSRRPTT